MRGVHLVSMMFGVAGGMASGLIVGGLTVYAGGGPPESATVLYMAAGFWFLVGVFIGIFGIRDDEIPPDGAKRTREDSS